MIETTALTQLQTRLLQRIHRDDEAQQWVFDFGEGHVLQVSSPWRLLVKSRIMVGSLDDGQVFGLSEAVDAGNTVSDVTRNRIVKTATVSDITADLSIDFGDDIRLEVFNNSAGYEGWVLNVPDGRALVAVGGGGLVEWKTKE